MVTTTPSHLLDIDVETEKQNKTTIKLTTAISSKLINSRLFSPREDLIEYSPCSFQGNKPDQYNCQCKKCK